MTRTELYRRAGGRPKAALLLGVTEKSISKWGTDLPVVYAQQLQKLRPDWFVVKPPKAKP